MNGPEDEEVLRKTPGVEFGTRPNPDPGSRIFRVARSLTQGRQPARLNDAGAGAIVGLFASFRLRINFKLILRRSLSVRQALL